LANLFLSGAFLTGMFPMDKIPKNRADANDLEVVSRGAAKFTQSRNFFFAPSFFA
jgi:hypothetical protein